MSKKLVVTRHPALVEVLAEVGLVDGDTPVVSHVGDPESLRGAHVFGVLPLHLAAVADQVTEAELRLRPEDRGKELDADELRERLVGFRTFKVQEV